MANPASGQITLAGIYNEGINGGCVTDAVSNFSLSACATGYGIGGVPDAMSEFYSLNCPGGVLSWQYASDGMTPGRMDIYVAYNLVVQDFGGGSGTISLSLNDYVEVFVYSDAIPWCPSCIPVSQIYYPDTANQQAEVYYSNAYYDFFWDGTNALIFGYSLIF